jgi:hypothetical protein
VKKSIYVRIVPALIASLLAILLVACSGEDRPDVDVVDDGGSGSVSGSGSSSGSVSASGTGSSSGSASASASASGSGSSGAATGGGLLIPAGQAPETEGPSASDGIFTPETNREIYQKISSDYQEIASLANVVNDGEPLPAAEILLLYEAGYHTRLGLSSRSLRGFARDYARTVEFPEAVEFYDSPTFLDTPINDAIAGSRTAENYTDAQRRQAILKGVLRVIYHWSLRYIQNAEETLNEGWVDEAWAIYVGEPGEDGSYPNSLSALARSREANFGREGTIDEPMREAMVRAQAAAKADDSAAYLEAANDIYSRFNALFYLATVRYLGESLASAEGGDIDAAAIQQVEGLSFYQSIQWKVAAADASADEAIVAFFTSAPDAITAEMRDAALEALNGTATALLLEDGDLVTGF